MIDLFNYRFWLHYRFAQFTQVFNFAKTCMNSFRKFGYQLKTGQVFTMKNMKRMKEKTKPFMFFMVINILLLRLYSQVSRLKEEAENSMHKIQVF